MSTKTFFVSGDSAVAMEGLSKILAAEHISFSHWVCLQAKKYVDEKENPHASKDEIVHTYPPLCTLCGSKAEKWGLSTDHVWLGFCIAHFDKKLWVAWR